MFLIINNLKTKTMKLEFDRMANGGYVIDLKGNSDFNLHLERMSNEEDVYIYVRGSSEGEYKFYKKVFGKVVDMDFDIPEAITPKYYRIKTSVTPTLCEVTGDVENVTGQEVVPPMTGIHNLLVVNVGGEKGFIFDIDEKRVIQSNIPEGDESKYFRYPWLTSEGIFASDDIIGLNWYSQYAFVTVENATTYKRIYSDSLREDSTIGAYSISNKNETSEGATDYGIVTSSGKKLFVQSDYLS